LLSRRTDAAEERLSDQSPEVGSLRALAESIEKESALALERLSRREVDIARLAAEVAALHAHSEGAQKQLARHDDQLGLDRTGTDFSRVASDVAQLKGAVDVIAAHAVRVDGAEVGITELRVAVLALKGWTAPTADSLVIGEFPSLFDEFRRKRLNLLWRSSHDG
jgi:chromosome segregation ATPase